MVCRRGDSAYLRATANCGCGRGLAQGGGNRPMVRCGAASLRSKELSAVTGGHCATMTRRAPTIMSSVLRSWRQNWLQWSMDTKPRFRWLLTPPNVAMRPLRLPSLRYLTLRWDFHRSLTSRCCNTRLLSNHGDEGTTHGGSSVACEARAAI
jgi:hypothetical protein